MVAVDAFTHNVAMIPELLRPPGEIRATVDLSKFLIFIAAPSLQDLAIALPKWSTACH